MITRRLIQTEVKLMFREPLVLIFSLAFPVAMMVLLLLSFGGENNPVFTGGEGTVFYVTAYLAAAIAVLGFMGMPAHIASYRESGVLRRYWIAGLASHSIVAAQVVVMTLLAVAGAAVQLAIAYGGFALSAPYSVVEVTAAFVVGIISFSAIGVLLGSLLPSARAAQGLGLVLFFGTFFLVGGGPPTGVLPDVVNTIAGLTPTGLLVDSIRSPWIGNGTDAASLIALAAIAAASFALAIRRLDRT